MRPHLAALQRALDRPADGGRGARTPSSSTATPGTRNLGGHLAKLIHGIPHVATVHSLEPLRPWKAEQLGGGYASRAGSRRRALEAADAVIAVSARLAPATSCGVYPGDRSRTACTSIYNGIDTSSTRADRRHRRARALRGRRRERPSVVFVGRITRQKGVELPAARGRARSTRRPSSCSAPALPTRPSSAPRSSAASAELRAQRDGVIWLERDAAQARCDPAAEPRDRVRLPVDLRAARDRQPRGDGVRGGRSSRPPPAGSSRSSTTARPACSSRSSPATTAPAPRAIRDALRAPTSPSASTRCCADPELRRRRWAGPDAGGRSSISRGRDRRAGVRSSTSASSEPAPSVAGAWHPSSTNSRSSGARRALAVRASAAATSGSAPELQGAIGEQPGVVELDSRRRSACRHERG